jgi:ABC-type antimicrobial peptide transport system permease subunit
VVGVTKTTKNRSLREEPTPFFYLAMRQNTYGVNFFVRASLSQDEMTRALVREIHSIDSNLAPGEVITMEEQVARTMAIQRVAVLMLGVFGGLALLLAAIGLYGVMSYTVSQRTRELGLRMALGADAGDLVRLVMSNGFLLMATGVVFGAVASVALTRLIGNLLYKVSPRDPSVFGIAIAVMAFATLVACFVPARRATRTDALQALRG